MADALVFDREWRYSRRARCESSSDSSTSSPPRPCRRPSGFRFRPKPTQVPWWLRLKGTRDVVSGLVVFAILAVGEPKLLGIALLILALIPIGDMTVVLSGKGRAATAFGVHGVTAAVMILGAIPLVAGLA